jgi:hypothetical protein
MRIHIWLYSLENSYKSFSFLKHSLLYLLLFCYKNCKKIQTCNYVLYFCSYITKCRRLHKTNLNILLKLRMMPKGCLALLFSNQSSTFFKQNNFNYYTRVGNFNEIGRIFAKFWRNLTTLLLKSLCRKIFLSNSVKISWIFAKIRLISLKFPTRNLWKFLLGYLTFIPVFLTSLFYLACNWCECLILI